MRMETQVRVLIIDDDVDLASNLRDILEGEGYAVSVAHDAQSALTLCDENTFDLGIVDIKLPDVTGVKLIDRLTEVSPHTEYIIMTGYASLDSAIEAVKQKRIVAYETKPLDMVRFLSLIEQVTKRRQAEEDLVALRKLDQLKDEFMSLISHELRSPLTVIMGAVNTALTEYTRLSEQEMRQLLSDASYEAEVLSHLLGDLLELARAQAGQISLYEEPLDIDEVVRDTVAKIKRQSNAHHFMVRTGGKLPLVKADRLRLERILYNLLDNAVKYSPAGGDVKVFAREDGDCLVIGVSDQGIGIPLEDQQRLFEPFQRLGNKLEGVSGIGLGLVVCQRLVQAHGGRIWVESAGKQGSTFYFTLPVFRETECDGPQVR